MQEVPSQYFMNTRLPMVLRVRQAKKEAKKQRKEQQEVFLYWVGRQDNESHHDKLFLGFDTTDWVMEAYVGKLFTRRSNIVQFIIANKIKIIYNVCKDKFMWVL